MVSGPKDLAGVQDERPPTEPLEVVIDLVALDRFVLRDDALEQFPQGRNIPLSVAEIVDQAALGLGLLHLEQTIEGPIGGRHAKVLIQHHERAAHRVDQVVE